MNSPNAVPVSDSELASVVLAALERSAKPLTTMQLRRSLTGPFKVDANRLNPILDSLQQQGKIVRRGTPKTPAFWDRDPVAEACKRILSAARLEALTLTDLKEAVGRSGMSVMAGDFAAAVKQLLAEGKLHRHDPLPGTRLARVSVQPISLVDILFSKMKKTRESLQAVLARAQKSRPDASEADVLEALQQLESSGRIHRHPPTKKTDPAAWSLNPPDLSSHFKALKPVVETRAWLLELGLNASRVDDAFRAQLPLDLLVATHQYNLVPIPDDLRERILLIVRAAHQPLLSLPELRLLLNLPKAEFDAAVLSLRDEGRVELHFHDDPFGIVADKRDELVAEKNEKFYVGIAAR